MKTKQSDMANVTKLVSTALACLILFGAGAVLQAQVTIGSGNAPLTGALLTLQSKADGNSDRGLKLPCVELSAHNELKIGGVIYADEAAHAGLVVYNVSKDNGFCPGPHVWDGTNWVAIGGVVVPKPDQSIIIDGETYTGKWFSADPCDPNAPGTYWLTENLYTTIDNQNNVFADGVLMNPGYYEEPDGAITIGSKADLTNPTLSKPAYAEWSISDNTPTTNTSVERMFFAKKFGLMYTWDQAITACPTGWRLPDDTDWNNLATAMGGINVAGKKMRENDHFYRSDDYSMETNQWGEYDGGVTPSGFNAVPSGYVSSDGEFAKIFSSSAYWWSATTGNYYYLNYGSKDLTHFSGGMGFYFSVRCMQD